MVDLKNGNNWAKEIKRQNRAARGQISQEDLVVFLEVSGRKLIFMLEEEEPQKRTIAATILGDRKDLTAIMPLCYAIKSEKFLYSRIAMSEALGKMGEPAVQPLINLLGNIGNNQEVELPSRYFKKKSFPLPRDMAARTLIKIGTPATPPLIRLMEFPNVSDNFVIHQAIDAIGGIAAKTGDTRGADVLINNINLPTHDVILLWKTVRALSSYKNNHKAAKALVNVLKSNETIPVIWESIRSIGKIGIKDDLVLETLNNFKNYKNQEVLNAFKVALMDLGVNSNF